MREKANKIFYEYKLSLSLLKLIPILLEDLTLILR